MEMTEIGAHFAAGGWSIHQGDAADPYCLDFPDRRVSPYARIEQSDRMVVVRYNPVRAGMVETLWFVSAPEFDAACHTIHPGLELRMPLASTHRMAKDSELEDLVRVGLEWVALQDVALILEGHAKASPDSPGLDALYHLAALAALHCISTLKRYQGSFEAGDCMGMMAFITKGHIDRALELARRNNVTG
mgnify:CR=1 FL=1